MPWATHTMPRWRGLPWNQKKRYWWFFIKFKQSIVVQKDILQENAQICNMCYNTCQRMPCVSHWVSQAGKFHRSLRSNNKMASFHCSHKNNGQITMCVIVLVRGCRISAIEYHRHGNAEMRNWMLKYHNLKMTWQVSAVPIKTMVTFSLENCFCGEKVEKLLKHDNVSQRVSPGCYIVPR